MTLLLKNKVPLEIWPFHNHLCDRPGLAGGQNSRVPRRVFRWRQRALLGDLFNGFIFAEEPSIIVRQCANFLRGCSGFDFFGPMGEEASRTQNVAMSRDLWENLGRVRIDGTGCLTFAQSHAPDKSLD